VTAPTLPPAAPSLARKDLRALLGGDRIDPRYYSSALITAVLVSAQLTLGVLEGLDRLALAIATCVVTELVLSRILLGRWPNLASAYISGISVGILVRSLALWPFVIGAALAIMSKYVLRLRGRHLWNPSNFSVVLMLVTAPAAVNALSRQWSNSPLAIAIIWAFGLLVVWRVSRLHVTLTYVAAFCAGAAVRSWLTGVPLLAEIGPLTGPMYQLFIFFMVTDPPTGVSTRAGRMGVVVLVAVVETVLRLFEQVNAPFYALFLVGPLALAIDLRRTAPAREVAAGRGGALPVG